MKAITAKDVTYVYPDGTVGIVDATLEIESGEKVALLGANGSGKSTLLLLFSGLVKPKSGHIEIFGKKVDKSNWEFFRRNVGVLFQNPDDFLFNSTVREELLYTPAQLDLPEEEAIKLANEYAKTFGIEKLLDKPPFRLSGGEKKKVALACVLMMKPKLLLLDEPTANVDGKTRRKIVEIINSLDTTLVIATHELDLVPKVANKVVLLGLDRRILSVGGLELLENEDLLEKAGVI